MKCEECDRSPNCEHIIAKATDCPLAWEEKKAEEMTHEQAIEAVKALRKVVIERITEPVSDAYENMRLTKLWDENTINKLKDDWKPTFMKPPLGCKPAYVSSSERIKELSDAIARQPDDPDLVKKWAVEILYHCEILKNVK